MKTAHFLSFDETASQNLALGSLSNTFDFKHSRKLEMVIFKASQSISETITIVLDSAKGANYDGLLAEIVLVSEQNYIFLPQGEVNLQKNDKLLVTCTNANGVGIIYVNVKTSEL